MLSRLNVATKIKEKCNSNNVFVYNYQFIKFIFHTWYFFQFSNLVLHLLKLLLVMILYWKFKWNPIVVSSNFFIYDFYLFSPFLLSFFSGGGRGLSIGFSQNSKVDSVSFQYAKRKHNFERIENLPFLDFSESFKCVSATILHANIMPIKAWNKTSMLKVWSLSIPMNWLHVLLVFYTVKHL